MDKETDKQISALLSGKSELTLSLFNCFISHFQTSGPVALHPAKTMIGIANSTRRIAWVTQLGKNFIDIVFPFEQAYPDNLCFRKIAQVPGQSQFNHHLRIMHPDNINDEVLHFMKLAWNNEQS
ncbi:hypothetical protein FPZ43_11065 [Mucilaginibacter pallidiroseus]|uniref:Uncharacterized protein n=1 Tax=Mucilaginibacter pallidiroseus TaxID=2599295 RepID=A0A563UBU0_9SPHI|nr:DUF5655 domain-containing protein [Mucilaginibacter pallidiroseus]TWR28804.1 hypothetical protein FPZ43_11065 [Mucilaginibacter pallidiroseus]